MKKILISCAFLAMSIGAMAQQNNDDQLDQQPPRETQVEMERAAARDARQKEAEAKQKEADAKERAAEVEQRNAAIKKDEEEQKKSKSKSKK